MISIHCDCLTRSPAYQALAYQALAYQALAYQAPRTIKTIMARAEIQATVAGTVYHSAVFIVASI